jgi:uncharacterized protein (DUF433 family)
MSMGESDRIWLLLTSPTVSNPVIPSLPRNLSPSPADRSDDDDRATVMWNASDRRQWHHTDGAPAEAVVMKMGRIGQQREAAQRAVERSAVDDHGASVIRRDPEVMSGIPVFAGTGVPVRNLIDYLKAGDDLDRFLDDFPTVSREQAVAALEELAQETIGTLDAYPSR